MSFMPLHQSTRNAQISDELYLSIRRCKDSPPSPAIPGFVGYAINMIQLRPPDEYIRYEALWGMFKDLMIFETREAIVSYTFTLDAAAIEAFWAVGLDDYSAQELNDTFPRFKSFSPRQSYYYQDVDQTAYELEMKLQNARYSDAVMLYS
jgi:hypothetical protein